MDRTRRAPPFDAETLERAALAHVGRVQTSRARLLRWLEAQLGARGWAGPGDPPLAALAGRLEALGLVDDQAFAAARARSAAARGHGRARLRDRLAADGIAPEAAEAVLAGLDPRALALAFARRRRLGPFGTPPADEAERRRQVAVMVRAGHAPELARRIVSAPSEEALESL